VRGARAAGDVNARSPFLVVSPSLSENWCAQTRCGRSVVPAAAFVGMGGVLAVCGIDVEKDEWEQDRATKFREPPFKGETRSRE
jgi:hypothetical protein